MPSISTMLYPIPAYVRVEVNWADVGAAVGAAVYRVDCLTGERVPLRPYVSFSGDFLDLSCGYGIFWDTEPQLDRCVYYCTDAADAAGDLVTAPAANLVTDTFTRVVAAGMGSTDNGLPYTVSGGIAANYSVNGTKGQQQLTGTNVARRSTVDPGHVAFDAQITLSPGVLALTQPIVAGIMGRASSSTNYYTADAQFGPGGTVSLYIREGAVEGAHIDLVSTSTSIVQVASTAVTVRFQGIGNQLRAKLWEATTPEPTDWMVTTTSSTWLTQTQLGFRSILIVGNTNVTPVNILYDNFLVTDPCADPETIEVCSEDLVVPSSGDFRLGDPVRPCNDVTLQLVGEIDPACVPTQGIFFGNMADESYESNSGALLPTNDSYPIVVNRARRAVTSSLAVATRTFNDRDAMLNLLAPGSPVFLRGPAQYGIPDRYMSVGTVVVGRHVSDHKVQPRSIDMPHAAVRRPSGPSQGVCGTRVDDLCDIYGSWDAVIAAGLTYADLLRGAASNVTPIPDTVERDWAEVNSDYASWTALNAGEANWDETLAGD